MSHTGGCLVGSIDGAGVLTRRLLLAPGLGDGSVGLEWEWRYIGGLLTLCRECCA